MKFKEIETIMEYYCTTDDDIYYRCNYNGTVWERLYGESWEAVHSNEEVECHKAWQEGTRAGYTDGHVSDGGMDPRI